MKKQVLIPVLIVMLIGLFKPVASASRGDALYEDARKSYEALMANEDAKANRANWLKVIAKFERVYQEEPSSSHALKAYFMAGKLSFYCFKYHRNRAELERGRKNLEAVARKYPSSPLADDALYYLGELYLKAGDKKLAAYNYRLVVERYPKGDMSRDARQRLEQLKMWPMPAWLKSYQPGQAVVVENDPAEPPPKVPETNPTSGRVLIKQIKYLSNAEYTRVIISCKHKANHGEIQYVKGDPASHSQPRLFLDIFDARLAPGVERPQDINDGLLVKLRAGQFTPDTVRVVLEIGDVDTEQTRVFPIEESGEDYRIIIDLSAKKKKTSRANGPAAPEPKKIIRRIVLDPGHGGKDPGAIGPNGLQEKDITLAVALLAQDILAEGLKLDVRLTRNKDVYLPLEERTGYANMLHIEDETLFVSLHTNAAEEHAARGIETYILDVTNDRAAMRLAAIENKVSIEAIDAFQSERGLIFALFQKAKADESYNLALDVQRALVKGMGAKYDEIHDHGVKEAPFFVLMGAKMPCILVEMSFISNPEEEKRLDSEKYRLLLAQSLTEGIAEYIKKKNTVATAVQ